MSSKDLYFEVWAPRPAGLGDRPESMERTTVTVPREVVEDPGRARLLNQLLYVLEHVNHSRAFPVTDAMAYPCPIPPGDDPAVWAADRTHTLVLVPTFARRQSHQPNHVTLDDAIPKVLGSSTPVFVSGEAVLEACQYARDEVMGLRQLNRELLSRVRTLETANTILRKLRERDCLDQATGRCDGDEP